MARINDSFIDYVNSIVGGETEKKLTQDSLSKTVGCSAVSMSRYLNNQREIPVETLFKIKRALNISDYNFMSFYQAYSIKENKIEERFRNLTDENKEKLLDYMSYLEYKENNIKQKSKQLKK